jgi:hypothetical protein
MLNRRRESDEWREAMSALDLWLTVLFGWVVISIVTGLVVGRLLHRVLALPNRVPSDESRR